MTTGLISERSRTSRGGGTRHTLARRVVIGRLADLSGGGVILRDGTASWTLGTSEGEPVTLEVKDPRFYSAVVRRGTLGAAEAWIEGWWTCDQLVSLLRLMIRNLDRADDLGGWQARLRRPLDILGRLLKANTRTGSRRNIHAHYDLGNEFFQCFLDETMSYSAAIFETPATSLQDASEAKLDRLIAKLDLRSDNHLLEIGTGWGSMAIRAAHTTGCRVTTTTISHEQAREARARINALDLNSRIEVLEVDYRDLKGTYDRVVAVEMIEAVGHAFLPAFFRTCQQRLKVGGRLVLQAIAMPDGRYRRYLRSTDFIREIVFPGSCCPSVHAMTTAALKHTDFKLTHLEDMASHYALTLKRWRLRFQESLERVRSLHLDDPFIRLWIYYLSYCEAGFSEDYIRSLQLVFDRPGANALPPLAPLPNLRQESP